MSSEKKSLIDQLLEDAKSVVEKARMPFVKSKVRRAFTSAVESAEESKIDANLELTKLRKQLIEYPEDASRIINQIAEQRNIILDADNTIEILTAEKTELF